MAIMTMGAAGLLGGLGLLGALFGGGAGLASSAMAGASSKEAAELQTEEARRQFDLNLAWQREQLRSQQNFYERMSNTAHQREVDDLLAAGLNPILSVTGGNGASAGSVSSPSGLAPTAQAQMPDYIGAAQIAQQGVNSAIDNMNRSLSIYADMALKESQITKNLADAQRSKDLTPAQVSYLGQAAEQAGASAMHYNALSRSIQETTPANIAKLQSEVAKNTEQARNTALKTDQAPALFDSQLATAKAMRDHLKVQDTSLARDTESKIDFRRAQARYFDRQIGQQKFSNINKAAELPAKYASALAKFLPW